ncbi:MAG TPA: peptidase M42, partial [Candidatus Methylomirabilis sp.]|nr:peptidase M42 [Candidatus Methylomirabilis sp.]
MPLPSVNPDFLLKFLVDLLNTPSPTGLAQPAVELTAQALAAFPGLQQAATRKGALLAAWPGRSAERSRALTAHLDTLGAMVKEIKPSGRLKLSKIGGYAFNTVEGEGCTIFTQSGQQRGSLLIRKASAHVHSSEVGELKRDEENMEVRLDARTANPEETRALGIEVGDFVAFDPRVEVVNGFVRSRHLDDKACAACLVAAVEAISRAGLQPCQT